MRCALPAAPGGLRTAKWSEASTETQVEVLGSEDALLDALVAAVRSLDPDIIIGWEACPCRADKSAPGACHRMHVSTKSAEPPACCQRLLRPRNAMRLAADPGPKPPAQGHMPEGCAQAKVPKPPEAAQDCC